MDLTPAVERTIWQSIFTDLSLNGIFCAPRGLKVLELENYSYTLPPYMRFCNFDVRKMSMDYIKWETQWFLRGDPYDLSIMDHATMWRNLSLRGRINSNYGAYIYRGGGFDWVIEELLRDRDSRRACMTILNESHMRSDAKDVPCTAYLNFRVRQNKLNMSVHMRSQDAIYGMTNDAPAFSFIHEMVFETLRENGEFEDLEMGDYFHTADSFHIYERHFDMLGQLIQPDAAFTQVSAPRISGGIEVRELIACNWMIPERPVQPNHEFIQWLKDVKPCLVKKA